MAESPFLAEAVEKVGFREAREFTKFENARDECLQKPAHWLYAPSGCHSDCLDQSLRVDDAQYHSVRKKFLALSLKQTFSTASAINGHAGDQRRTTLAVKTFRRVVPLLLEGWRCQTPQ